MAAAVRASEKHIRERVTAVREFRAGRPPLTARLRSFLTGVRALAPTILPFTRTADDEPVPTEPIRWHIPIVNDDPAHPDAATLDSKTAAGWREAFTRLKEVDEAMFKDFKDDIDTLLVFAGLFSGVLTAFIVQSFGSLQEDNSSITANALYHISLQLSDPSTGPLPLRPLFTAAKSDVRVNALWIISLVMSLAAALLAIMVKQWLREYMTWTTMMPGPTTVALRQFRARGWQKWDVRRWRDAIPVLLQLALILFLGGLVELVWSTNETIAIIITIVVGIGVVFFGLSTVIPTFSLQCPFRTPAGWLFRRACDAAYHIVRLAFHLLWAMLSFRLSVSRLRLYIQDFMTLMTSISWDYEDILRMDDEVVAHKNAMRAVAEVVTNYPSSDVLAQISSGLYKVSSNRIWLPIEDLWSMLEGLLGDDVASREAVMDMLEGTDTEELIETGSLSKDYCNLVVRLVRQALRTHESCSAENLQSADYSIGLTSVIAMANQAALPYHTTTLVWLLHPESPHQLVKIAERHIQLLLRCGSLGDAEASIRWSNWKAGDISGLFTAASAAVKPDRLANGHNRRALLDAMSICMRVATLNAKTIEEDPHAQTALRALFADMDLELRETMTHEQTGELPASSQGWVLLTQDWRDRFADLLEVPLRIASRNRSLVPVELARTVLHCLDVETDADWTSGAELPLDDARQLAIELRNPAVRDRLGQTPRETATGMFFPPSSPHSPVEVVLSPPGSSTLDAPRQSTVALSRRASPLPSRAKRPPLITFKRDPSGGSGS